MGTKIKPRQKYMWFRDPFEEELPADGIFVDGFAGGGGASVGIARALGYGPHIAINHDRDAISMHIKNHPETRHYCEDIFSVDPVTACEGKPVKGAWFSPDCTHFSKAKGAVPKEKNIRGLAWVVRDWAKLVKPNVIFLENVEEFVDWGPLDDEGMPIKKFKGWTFREWVYQLEQLGYVVEWRNLVASDYGAPTSRKRLFLVARRDGKPIHWPSATHGSPKVIRKLLRKNGCCNLRKWKPVADIIDWSLPWPSIFDTKEEIKEKYNLRAQRPLADNTMKRIAEGIRRYVIEDPNPFIVKTNHAYDQFRGQSIDDPLQTITAKHGFGVVRPIVMGCGGRAAQSNPTPIDYPLGTITAKNDRVVIAPYVAALQHGGSTRSIKDPIHTITASRKDCNLLAAPVMMQYYGPRNGDHFRSRGLDQPLATQTTENRHAMVSAFITKHFGGQVGVPATYPLPTITMRGTQNMITTATIVQHNHGGKTCFDPRHPLPTIRAQGLHQSVVTCHLKEVRAFLFKYYGSGGQWNSVKDPSPTITAKDRLVLGVVEVDRTLWQIVDIGMRMLTPRELFDAQGFPSNYEIEEGYDGRPVSKSAQVARCGNSVSPHPAEALVKANLEAV